MEKRFKITLPEIQAAQQELRKYLKPSPLLYNPWLSEVFHCQVYLKLENMQPIGSFKIRGATYKISQLTPQERKAGIVAASAGNHAQGVAWGARQLGVHPLIVMPTVAPIMKQQNTKALGADITLYGKNYDEAYHYAREVAKKTGRIYIPAFEDPKVVAGQGTVGLEVLKQLPEVDYIIGAVGGGGLMAGVGTAVKALKPSVQLVGCQAVGADSMIRSIRRGKAICLDSVNTFADGISIMQASEKLRSVLDPLIDDWISVPDEAIAAAILTLLEKAKIMTEGSGAIPLAALESLGKKAQKKKVVLLITGGNIDVNVLSRIIELGLIRTGRRVRLSVWIADRPGALANLTRLIADQGSNILQAFHDHNESSTRMDQTEVNLTLETPGPRTHRFTYESTQTPCLAFGSE